MSDKNNREYFRMPFNVEAICFLHDQNTIVKGVARDISIGGIYIVVEDLPPVTGLCEIQLIMEGLYSRIDITRISGKIIRSDSNGLAISFDHHLEWISLVASFASKYNEKEQLQKECLFLRP